MLSLSVKIKWHFVIKKGLNRMNKTLKIVIISLLTLLLISGGVYAVNRFVVNKPEVAKNVNQENIVNNPDLSTPLPNNNIKDTTPSVSESNSTDSKKTLNWKIYQNEVWGFSFKYPPEYSITTNNLPVNIVSDSSTRQLLELSNSGDKNDPKIILYLNPAGWGYENFDKDVKRADFSNSDFSTQIIYSEDSVSNYRMVDSIFDVHDISYFFYLSHKGTDDYFDTFSNILSTFKFINETENWKTLTSNSGWTIKYPSDYKPSSCANCNIQDAGSFVSFKKDNATKDGYVMIEPRIAKQGEYNSTKELLDSMTQFPIQEKISTQDLGFNGYLARKIIFNNSSNGSNNEMEYLFVAIDSTKGFTFSFTDANTKMTNLKIGDYNNYQTYQRMLYTFKINK